MDIGFQVTGMRRVQQKFDDFPAQAHDSLLATITGLTAQLEAMVRGAAPKRTGALASAITSRVFDNEGGNRIRGRVAVTLPSFAKAATLEYGSRRTITVNLSDAHARAAQSRQKFTQALARPYLTVADQYQRTLNIPAFRYLRNPLAAIAPEAMAELKAAVAAAVAA